MPADRMANSTVAWPRCFDKQAGRPVLQVRLMCLRRGRARWGGAESGPGGIYGPHRVVALVECSRGPINRPGGLFHCTVLRGASCASVGDTNGGPERDRIRRDEWDVGGERVAVGHRN